MPRIDKGPQSHLGDGSGTARGNTAIQMRDAAERQIVGFDPVGERELAQFWHQRPVTSDNPLQQAIMREAVEPPVPGIARRRRKHQRQRRRMPVLAIALLERDQQFVRRSDADKPGRADGIAVADNGDGLIGRDDLVFHHLRVNLSRPAIPRCPCSERPAICWRRTSRHAHPATGSRNSPWCRHAREAPASRSAE